MNFIADLIDLILPEHCAGCGGAPVLLCDACAMPLRGPARPARTTLGGLPPPWTVAAYEGPLRAILAAYKEHGRTALTAPLGEALATAVRAALAPHLAPDARDEDQGVKRSRRAAAHSDRAFHLGHDPPVVVWVPSRRGAVRRRGHDALRGVVEVAVRRLHTAGVPVIGVDALKQRGRVADQAALTAAQRTANLQGALEVKPGAGVAGRRIVLVDDVVTTGASLTDAARALRAAGAEPLAAATIAATPRRRR
ncbi:phosphoribosyltransferase family protein [Spirillospora sp. NPDC048819]|uniref:ComF family protein n=1 Tax=Spirillospora sp. NPDC048819 TaxID=3155268 RepID=UPI0033E308B3